MNSLTKTETSVNQTPYQIAVELCKRGFSVIPSGGGDTHKAPLVTWAEWQTRKPDEAQLAEWENTLHPMLWGIVTGSISKVVVLDPDTPEALKTITKKLGMDKPHIGTPRKGGHIYAVHPGFPVKTTVGILPGVDIRADGGFVNVVGTRPDGCYIINNLPSHDNLLPWFKIAHLLPKADAPKVTTAKPGGKVIPNGERNARMTSLAGTMRRRGMTQEAILAALKATPCETPLPERELEAIAKSVGRYAPAAPNGDRSPLDDTLHDVGNAARLVSQFEHILRYNYERTLWLIYNGKYWEWDDGGRVVKMAKVVIRNIYREAGNTLDEDKQDKLAKWAKQSHSNMRIKGMLELAQGEVSVKVADLNANYYQLNVNNGTIDLHTGELLPHRAGDLITHFIPIDYDMGKQGAAVRWFAFLDRIFEGNHALIDYIQKCIGYGLTGDQTEQCFWFNEGSGWNGKSTLYGTISDILGEYSGEVDPQAFMVDRNAHVGPNEALASLYGKRFVTSTETKTAMRMNVSLVKRMTGGEKIRCERKFEHGFDFKPTHKLFMLGNERPRIDDQTNSIWFRLKYVPFNVTIPDGERDKNLRATLVKEEGEAILAWLVNGCLLWQKEGLSEPKVVVEAVQEYRDSQDILHDYIAENCLLNKAETMMVADLYKDYLDWAKDNNFEPIGKNNFGNRLKDRGFTTTRGNYNKLFWRGIRLFTKDEKRK